MEKPRKSPRRVNLGELWTCPKCSRQFANRNQQHACGHWTVREHFQGKPPALRKLFNQFLAIVRENGPARIHAAKTRIAFITRMTFAAATPARDRLKCHVILTRRVDSPRFKKIEEYSPRCFGHYFEVRADADLDGDLRRLIAEAYRVGMQQQLRGRRASVRSALSKRSRLVIR